MVIGNAAELLPTVLSSSAKTTFVGNRDDAAKPSGDHAVEGLGGHTFAQSNDGALGKTRMRPRPSGAVAEARPRVFA